MWAVTTVTCMRCRRDTCRRIGDGALQRELEHFKKLKDITIEVSDEVRDLVAEQAYARRDEEGARG